MHTTPEAAAKDVLTGDLGPLRLSFSQFRTRMITEYPHVLSDTVLHDLYIRFSEPDPDVVMPRLVELLKGEPPWARDAELGTYFTIALNETVDPADLFGPINLEGLSNQPEEPEEHDVLAAIQRVEGKVDNTQRLQEVILKNQLAQFQAKKKQKRQRALEKVRNKFKRRA